jgi:ketosteroid isomerase-like protein
MVLANVEAGHSGEPRTHFPAEVDYASDPSLAQDKVTIDKLNADFMAAFDKGDMATIGQMYTEDAYLLPSGGPMVKGRAAIQSFWTNAAEASETSSLRPGT